MLKMAWLEQVAIDGISPEWAEQVFWECWCREQTSAHLRYRIARTPRHTQLTAPQESLYWEAAPCLLFPFGHCSCSPERETRNERTEEVKEKEKQKNKEKLKLLLLSVPEEQPFGSQ